VELWLSPLIWPAYKAMTFDMRAPLLTHSPRLVL
jgi:hypothetical protein